MSEPILNPYFTLTNRYRVVYALSICLSFCLSLSLDIYILYIYTEHVYSLTEAIIFPINLYQTFKKTKYTHKNKRTQGGFHMRPALLAPERETLVGVQPSYTAVGI